MFVRGERLSHRPETARARIRARRIGVLLQTGNLIQHLDLRGNVRVAELAGGTPGAGGRRTDVLLEQVGLAARRHAYPTELSGGELARAGLAVALRTTPTWCWPTSPLVSLTGTPNSR